MANKRQDELRELLDDPNETLENEYKSWLDLKTLVVPANLARHISALANHGGGRIILGFNDDLEYSGSDPHSQPWDHDTVASIVKKYLEPPFQCDVYLVQSAAGNEHPVILVPPHGAVPICAKADGPMIKGKVAGIAKGIYYIRKPGPESAPITSANEWRVLIRRCITHERTSLIAAIDASLRGATTAIPGAGEELRAWHEAAHEMFVRSVEKFKAPAELARRNVQLSYLIERDDGQRLDPEELPGILLQVNAAVHDLVHTGWSMFYVFSKPGVAPTFTVDPAVDGGEDDFLESSKLVDISSRGFGADTWRVASDGKATLIRDYWEDDVNAVPRTGMLPGSWFSPNIMAEFLAEFVRHARGFAERFNAPTNVVFRCEWRGLAGRRVFDPNVFWREGRTATADSRFVTATFPVGALTNNWPDIVARLGGPVARLFGIGQTFSPQWIVGQAPKWRR
jgi:hypothetical protein